MEMKMKNEKTGKRWGWYTANVLLVLSAGAGALCAAYGAVSSVVVVNGFKNLVPPVIWIGLVLFFVGLAVLYFRCSNGARIAVLLLCILLAAGSYFAFGVLAFAGRTYMEPVTVSSPDGAYEVTAHEWEVFKGSGVELTFRKKGRLFASEKVDVFTGGDAIFPFSHGDYEVVWEENAVTVRFAADGEEKTVFYRFEDEAS